VFYKPRLVLDPTVFEARAGNALVWDSEDLKFDVESDSIKEDELDLAITPVWTGEHTFSKGLTTEGNITPKSAGSQKIGTPSLYFNEVHATTFMAHSPKQIRRKILPELRKINIEDKDTLPEEVLDKDKNLDLGMMVSFLLKICKEQQKEIERLKRKSGDRNE